ncbi:MAG: hypothetical protein JWM53_4272 [bacterium]|nr:hypothetical protein [bacterium]
MTDPMMQSCDRVVLLVDDDTAIRETIAAILADEGYVVVAACNGAEALERLRNITARPCVILLDLMMPIMNGDQFYSEQKRDPKLAAIPVVLLSADPNLREKARAFGGDYLPKPVRIERVLDAIERHCA